MSSYYDDASLMLLASGGAQKDGKAYSIKPTDGTGDFTFTRGSNLSATRVNASQLIEKGRENLFINSNDFGSTSWGGSTTETGGQSGYDGSNAAWLIENAANAAYIRQDNTSSGVLTASVYAKAGNVNWVRFAVSNSPVVSVYFDLVNGVSSVPSNVISQTIVSVGNGWHRLSVTFLANSMSGMQFYPADGANNLGEAGDNIFLQDAQLEQGLVATDYIETTTTTGKAGILENTPRFDYSGGATCPSLLLEPSRTNLVPYSEDFSQWPVINSTILVNNIISPDGTLNAARITATLTGDGAFVRNTTAPQTTSTTYSFSCFVKKGTTNFVRLANRAIGGPTTASAWFDIENGVVGTLGSDLSSSKIEDFGNGWYRCIVIGTTGSTVPNQLIDIAASTSNATFAVSANDYIFYWGAQLEAGSYPTSYIPTNGVSQTRGADACVKTGISSLIGQTEGALFVDAANLFPSGSRTIALLYTSGSAFYQMYVNASNQVRVDINGSLVFVGGSIAANTNYKIAFAYKSGEYALYINGTQIATSASTTMPSSLTAYYLGNSLGGEQSGAYNQALLFKTRLSNLDLAILTGATTYNTFAAMALALNYTVYE